MTTRNLDFYRRRADQELDAAERASEPAIALIHREMAQRYIAKLGGETDRTSDAGIAQMAGAADARPRCVSV